MILPRRRRTRWPYFLTGVWHRSAREPVLIFIVIRFRIELAGQASINLPASLVPSAPGPSLRGIELSHGNHFVGMPKVIIIK